MYTHTASMLSKLYMLYMCIKQELTQKAMKTAIARLARVGSCHRKCGSSTDLEQSVASGGGGLKQKEVYMRAT